MWKGYEDDAPLTKINVQYTELTNRLMSYIQSKQLSSDYLAGMRSSVYHFKKAVSPLFCLYCDRGLNTLKFHRPYHLLDYLERFSTVSVLSTSQYEHLNLLLTSHIQVLQNSCRKERRITLLYWT